MPDLECADHQCEIPFWGDFLACDATTGGDAGVAATGEERSRISLHLEEGTTRLVLPDGSEFRFDPARDGWEAAQALRQWMTQHQFRLSPRAIPLTMFFRLLVADQFVHGIGGGRYDQVTDRLIASLFKMAPPRFAVTTATLYFPEAAGRTRACLPCVEREGHDLRHAALGARKLELVEQIAALPRFSAQRREVYHDLHRRLAAAAEPSLRDWQRRLEETRRQAREDEMLFDRELFYALQPRARLEEMVERYRQVTR